MPLNDEQRTLVEENMKLVPYILKTLEIPYWKMISDEDDLIQTGYMALCMAAQSFDSARGKFSTYACSAIRNEILQLVKCETARAELSAVFLREPDPNRLDETIENRIILEMIANPGWRQHYSKDDSIILLSSVSGYSNMEIAREHNISLSTVSRKINKTKRLVQMEYKNYNTGRMRA